MSDYPHGRYIVRMVRTKEEIRQLNSESTDILASNYLHYYAAQNSALGNVPLAEVVARYLLKFYARANAAANNEEKAVVIRSSLRIVRLLRTAPQLRWPVIERQCVDYSVHDSSDWSFVRPHLPFEFHTISVDCTDRQVIGKERVRMKRLRSRRTKLIPSDRTGRPTDASGNA